MAFLPIYTQHTFSHRFCVVRWAAYSVIPHSASANRPVPYLRLIRDHKPRQTACVGSSLERMDIQHKGLAIGLPGSQKNAKEGGKRVSCSRLMM